MVIIHGINWKNKFNDTTICYLQETHFRSKDANMLKMKEYKKALHVNNNQKRTGVAVLI